MGEAGGGDDDDDIDDIWLSIDVENPLKRITFTKVEGIFVKTFQSCNAIRSKNEVKREFKFKLSRFSTIHCTYSCTFSLSFSPTNFSVISYKRVLSRATQRYHGRQT